MRCSEVNCPDLLLSHPQISSCCSCKLDNMLASPEKKGNKYAWDPEDVSSISTQWNSEIPSDPTNAQTPMLWCEYYCWRNDFTPLVTYALPHLRRLQMFLFFSTNFFLQIRRDGKKNKTKKTYTRLQYENTECTKQKNSASVKPSWKSNRKKTANAVAFSLNNANVRAGAQHSSQEHTTAQASLPARFGFSSFFGHHPTKNEKKR